MQTKQLAPAAQQTLAAWHDILERNAMEELDPLLSDDILFRSPVAHTPYPGRTAIKLVLKNVNMVFQDFTYHRTLVSDDGNSLVLEFSAHVNGKQLKGIDMLRFDEQGKIVEFEVMVRPLSGLQELGKEMARRMAPYAAQLSGEAPTDS